MYIQNAVYFCMTPHISHSSVAVHFQRMQVRHHQSSSQCTAKVINITVDQMDVSLAKVKASDEPMLLCIWRNQVVSL